MIFLSVINGQSAEAALRALLKRHGPMEEVRPVPEARIVKKIGHVPNLLIDLWRLAGVGALRDRGLWLVMPDELDPITDRLFAGDPDLGGDSFPVAYGAMGNLLCWNSRHGAVLVMLEGGGVLAPGLTAQPRPDDDASLLRYLSELNPGIFDRQDRNNQGMLERAKAAHGPLKSGQVYASYPIHWPENGRGIEGVRLSYIDDYLTQIVLGTTFMLRDYEGGRPNLRRIGPEQ